LRVWSTISLLRTETTVGRIQIDRVVQMEKWAENIKNIQENEHIKLAIVAANNHYAGFGPGTANVFRNMSGSPEAKSQDREIEKSKRNHNSKTPVMTSNNVRFLIS